ncbi:MAG TPA: ATP-binding protein [Thermomicrobiales bacterium]|nr:ATP-binding protein [Thermomicrobiales bacterium]
MTRRWSLRTRFVLFATACLLPLVGVVLFFLDRGIQRNTDQLVNSEHTIANLSSQVMSGYLNGVVDTLDKLAVRPEIVSLNPEDSASTLALTRDVRTDVSGLLLVDASGQLVSTSGPAPTLLKSIPDQLMQTIKTGQPGISPPIQDTDDRQVLVITVPVATSADTAKTSTVTAPPPPATPPAGSTTGGNAATDQTGATGSNVGAIAAVINVSYLETIVVPYARGKTEIAIVSKDGVIVSTAGVQKNLPHFLDSERENIDQALEGDSGDFTTTDANDTARLGVFTPIQSDVATWAMIVTNPTPRAYAQTLLTQGLIVLLLASAVILALAVIFGEFTARPLRTLAARAASMQRGNFDVNIEPVGGGEVRALSTAFAEMGDQLANQMHGMEKSHQERVRQATQMRDLLRRTLRLQEDERRRIAGEIHDAVSPLITGALYQARALQMTNGSTPAAEPEETLDSVNKLLERASVELHGVIFDLRPPDLDDIGVVAAIEAYMQTIERTGLRCRLEVVKESPSLTPEVRLGIYRIVQEALHNVVRHAGADEAVVRLESTDDLLRVTIKDNGAGFDPELSVRPTSLGLLSMRERAAAIGASFTIISRPGGGTAIIIERAEVGSVMSDSVLADLMSNSLPYAPDGSGEPGDEDAEAESTPGTDHAPETDDEYPQKPSRDTSPSRQESQAT